MAAGVSLLVPQGWAVRGIMQAMNAEPLTSVLLTTAVLLAWGVAGFAFSVLRFNRRYV